MRRKYPNRPTHTQKVADSAVVALDLKNGTTLWKSSLPRKTLNLVLLLHTLHQGWKDLHGGKQPDFQRRLGQRED